VIEGACIFDRAYFNSPEWLAQKNADGGFSPAAAWLDLLALTNVKDTTFPRGAGYQEIKRGQCAWSVLGLHDRWGWSQGKVSARLKSWEMAGRIKVETSTKGIIITVVNYVSYQAALLDVASNQIESKPGANREQTVSTLGQIGIGIGITKPSEGEGKGKEEEAVAYVPDDGEVLEFGRKFAGELATGTPGPIPDGFVFEVLKQWHGRREFPRRWKPALVAEWRAGHRHAGSSPAKKCGGGFFKPQADENGETPAMRRLRLEREVRAKRQEFAALHSVGADYREVRAELDELEQQFEEVAA
jgi:hypothetical protein